MGVSLRIPEEMMDQLHKHLFQADQDEHGAVIAASVLETARGTKLLAHRLFLAEDGVDYVPGKRGYRMLTASFVMDCVLECADLKMAYLAVHCHGGTDSVGFSGADMASHDRGYPALLDILVDQPVGGLVFAKNAVAGDIWTPDGSRHSLDLMTIPGRPIRTISYEPRKAAVVADPRFDRQVRLFGDRGQELLQRQKVGVIGAGGAGSLLVEYLSRLGVGELVVIDPDRIDPTNLNRLVGSRRSDVRPWLTHERMPAVIRNYFAQHRTTKVDIARRVVRDSGSATKFKGYQQSVTDASMCAELKDCDYLFLAADSMQARLVFNALVHQYLIPGVQMGVKAQVDGKTGDVLDLFAIVRPVIPGVGCLWCNGLIVPSKLQEEATSPEQRARQRYVDDEDVPAPSVITMNAIAAGYAGNDYLMSLTGLLQEDDFGWLRFDPRGNEVGPDYPRRDSVCGECSPSGRLGRGDTRSLPTRN
ncbi:ThiF family adenylyltransferase [Arthrobacter sp. STN4]|uniref:ThiF family adenylyltransferase n=1 Tax=Arthrobacter sp. STN4 TaxID=2923276 RepID=UPI002119E06D|nr:ThiF family adenylyltransferase [Arthrobacter sp. STN4]MCQ9163106.1 ThiF family adenylyltransferase [Arthrobacter sp. STN4]